MRKVKGPNDFFTEKTRCTQSRRILPQIMVYCAHMTSNDIFRDTRVAHVRELKAEVARLKEELAREHDARESLESHFALALAAARDAERMPPDAELLIIDGWNAVIGTRRLDDAARHARRDSLVADLRARVAADPRLHVWALFDGTEMRAAAESDGRLRVGYTGGSGAHRADRMVCDYLRARKILGIKHPVTVVTDDKDFAKEAATLGAAVKGTDTLHAKTKAD